MGMVNTGSALSSAAAAMPAVQVFIFFTSGVPPNHQGLNTHAHSPYQSAYLLLFFTAIIRVFQLVPPGSALKESPWQLGVRESCPSQAKSGGF